MGLSHEHASSLPDPFSLHAHGDIVLRSRSRRISWPVAVTSGDTTTNFRRDHYPSDIIESINNLRIRNGLNTLSVHPVLMDVAAQQANALAASGGSVGHQRPCGLTLGRDLLSRGFALWGDLSNEDIPSIDAGQLMRQNSMVLVAFVISFSVLVAAIVGFGKRKE